MLIELHNINVAVSDKMLLNGVNFQVDEGEFVYLIGKVGSGKSSLLKVLYGELQPTGYGEAVVLEHDLYHLKRKHIPTLRKSMGIVFQDFRLLMERTVRENLDFVLRATGWKKKAQRENRIREVLTEVGMEEAANAFPHQLSGGEQQRVCIARALLNNPRIILADEPTGNLDRENSDKVLSLLKRVSERGTAVVTVTHNLSLLNDFPGVVYLLKNGEMKEMPSGYKISETSTEIPADTTGETVSPEE